MTSLLQLLSKFDNVNDRENSVAYYRTNVPWEAPLAYLNIVYKPADTQTLESASAQFQIPEPWVQFLATNNGAVLFSSYLYVLGVVEEGTLLDRNDPFLLPPINLEKTNRGLTLDRNRYIQIASYGHDGSLVCVDRQRSSVEVFHRNSNRSYASWPSTDDWVVGEVERLASLFDSRGKLLVEGSHTLPAHKA
jgi:hypothetical protein